MARVEKPPQMTMLEAKGIYARDCFRFRDSGDGCYAVSRTYQFIGLDGEPAQLAENEIWERYDAIEKITRADYEQAQAGYRDRIWRSRGQPDARELEALALTFLDAYCNHYEERRWTAVCRYDEETLRRLLERTVDHFFPKPPSPPQRQKKYQALFRELVLAKAALAAGRGPMSAVQK